MIVTYLRIGFALFFCSFASAAPPRSTVFLDTSLDTTEIKGENTYKRQAVHRNEEGVQEVLDAIVASLNQFSRGENPWLFMWFDEIAEREEQASVKISISSIHVGYFNQGVPWMPASIKLVLKRETRGSVQDRWVEGGSYSAMLSSSRLWNPELHQELVRQVFSKIPMQSSAGRCPAYLLWMQAQKN